MARDAIIRALAQNIRAAAKKYEHNKGWKSRDKALLALCGKLDNSHVPIVHAKIVAVDQIYKAGLIRYLPAPRDSTNDPRLARYLSLARSMVSLDLDAEFDRMATKSIGLDSAALPTVVSIHDRVATIVQQIVGRTGEVFAAKYLHFARPAFFPVFDSNAEENLTTLMERTDGDAGLIFVNRFDFNNANTRYDKYCRGLLSLQAALAEFGFGPYSLPDFDHYLYGHFEAP